MKFLQKSFPVVVGLGMAVVSYKLLDDYVIKPLYKEA